MQKRELGDVFWELGEYHEEQLETFTKIEAADNHVQVVVL